MKQQHRTHKLIHRSSWDSCKHSYLLGNSNCYEPLHSLYYRKLEYHSETFFLYEQCWRSYRKVEWHLANVNEWLQRSPFRESWTDAAATGSMQHRRLVRHRKELWVNGTSLQMNTPVGYTNSILFFHHKLEFILILRSFFGLCQKFRSLGRSSALRLRRFFQKWSKSAIASRRAALSNSFDIASGTPQCSVAALSSSFVL